LNYKRSIHEISNNDIPILKLVQKYTPSCRRT